MVLSWYFAVSFGFAVLFSSLFSYSCTYDFFKLWLHHENGTRRRMAFFLWGAAGVQFLVSLIGWSWAVSSIESGVNIPREDGDVLYYFGLVISFVMPIIIILLSLGGIVSWQKELIQIANLAELGKVTRDTDRHRVMGSSPITVNITNEQKRDEQIGGVRDGGVNLSHIQGSSVRTNNVAGHDIDNIG